MSPLLKKAVPAVTLLAIVVGVISLSIKLPYDYFPYFWDGANLLSDISDPDFVREGLGSTYALRKFGYSLPVHYLANWFGYSGVLIWNALWFLAMLAVGSVVLLRKKRILGLIVFLAGMVCLPYVHKYIGMANPTIQSMALWLFFFLACEKGREPIFRSSILPGILFGALILTDFPKWAIVGIPVILVRQFAYRDSFASSLISAGIIIGYGVIAFALAGLINSNYYHTTIVSAFLTDSQLIEGLRFGLSWNFILFLWLLGGFWILAYVLVFGRIIHRDDVRWHPGVIPALTIVAIFTVILWPRNARMFAVVVPFLIYLFARLLDQLTRSQPTHRWHRWAEYAATAIVLGFLIRAPFAGDSFQLPTGIREVNAFVSSSGSIPPGSAIGTFFGPPFELSAEPGYEWRYFSGQSVLQGMDWAVTGDVLDEMLIDDQVYNGSKDFYWRASRIQLLVFLWEQPVIAEFACDFYTSKWYLLETNFDDSHLSFRLRRASEIENPTWKLRDIRALHQR